MTTTYRFFPAFLVGGMLLASWRTASGQEQPQGGLEAPVETPAAEAAPEEKPGERSRPGILGRGIRSVLGAFSGGRAEREGPEAGGAEPGEKSSSDETQKKVNELTRVAHMNIDKGRIPEAIKNVNDLISLKPYEADFHLALGLCLRKEGKYGDALKKYQDVLDLGGPRALIALLKAEAYGAENKPDKVFEHLKEAAIGGRNIINDVRMLPLLSSYQQDTEFIKLALQLEKVAVSVARHHDPFTNPFPTADPQKAGGEAAEAPNTLTPEEQEKLLQEARKTYE
ncbi:MAG: tetratricopeptide repeat protein, partial [Planctomycetes bacterium]|nr:tetratricopeptide repeat protein [Planctomycetota bacterium]